MDVFFECIISANPWVTEVSWYFEGKQLTSNSSSGMIIANQSLVLQKVKRVHRGHYWCSAINNQGKGESHHFFLKVLCECTSLLFLLLFQPYALDLVLFFTRVILAPRSRVTLATASGSFFLLCTSYLLFYRLRNSVSQVVNWFLYRLVRKESVLRVTSIIQHIFTLIVGPLLPLPPPLCPLTFLLFSPRLL